MLPTELTMATAGFHDSISDVAIGIISGGDVAKLLPSVTVVLIWFSY